MPLIYAIFIAISIILGNLWFIAIGIVLITTSVIYQIFSRKWKMGCLSGIIVIFFSIFIFYAYGISQSPVARFRIRNALGITNTQQSSQTRTIFSIPIHKKYSKIYENKAEIQKILGVEFPYFKVVNYKVTTMGLRDVEFTVKTKIKYKIPPDSALFHNLDSICSLPMPKEPDVNSSYFYYGMEAIFRCWTKEGNTYKYNRTLDFGEKFLHTTNAFFRFEITKGSSISEIEYGDY